MPEPFITSVRIESNGNHDSVWVFVEGQCATALHAAQACRGEGPYEGRPFPALAALEAQLERLKPAFGQCEEVRKAMVQRDGTR